MALGLGKSLIRREEEGTHTHTHTQHHPGVCDNQGLNQGPHALSIFSPTGPLGNSLNLLFALFFLHVQDNKITSVRLSTY